MAAGSDESKGGGGGQSFWSAKFPFHRASMPFQILNKAWQSYGTRDETLNGDANGTKTNNTGRGRLGNAPVGSVFLRADQLVM